MKKKIERNVKLFRVRLLMPDKRRVLLDECVFQAPESDCFYYLGSWSLTCPLFVIQNRKAPTELIKSASDWVTKITAHDLGKK